MTSVPPAGEAPAAPPLDPQPPVGPRVEGLAGLAAEAWADLREVVHQRAHLLTLEVRLAGLTFVQLVLFAVLAAVLLVSAWVGLMAVLVAGAVYWWDVHWALGLAVGVLLNLALAAWLVRSMVLLLRRLDLQSTLRRLQGRPADAAE